MNVVVVGSGYVGLTTGLTLSFLGHRVVAVDKDSRKVEWLNAGKSPIHEAWVQEMLHALKGRMVFTDNLREVVGSGEVIMISVGTPSKHNGEADTQYVESAAREVAEGLLPGQAYCLVIKSTVPIGANRQVAHVVSRILAARHVDTKVFLASNPEFLREGMALRDSLYPDRIVVGAEEQEAVDVLRRLYRPILEQTFEPPQFLPRPDGYGLPPFITTDPTSAEMIKYAANAFLALKISFINEIAGLCEKVGADVTEVARGIGLDSRIGPRFLAAGLGWGGSCFPKDTAALIAVGREYGYEMPIVEASRTVNSRQRYRVVEKLQETLKGVRGRTIGILGVAFKPGTDDVRESPALEIAKILLERGAHLRVHDPVAVKNAEAAIDGDLRFLDIEFLDDVYELAKGADALVLSTEWREYRDLDLSRISQLMRTPVLVDGRNIFKPEKAREAGVKYMGVGR